MKRPQVCISPQVKSGKERGKVMTLHQLACDLEQVTSVCQFLQLEEQFHSMITEVPSCAFLYQPLCGTGYNFDSEVQGTPSNVFHFLPKPLGSPLALLP